MPDAAVAGVRVVFIAGMGRSGSTLIERMLGELPGVCPAGEVVHLWQRGLVKGERCGCGEPFRDCAFWTSAGEKAFGGWDQVDTERIAVLRYLVDRTRFIPLLAMSWQRPAFRSALDEYTSYYLRLYAAIRDVSGCGWVVDSSKHASLAFCLRSCPGLDLRVIHVVRDSRAVAYSWSRRVRRPDASGESYMGTHSPAAAAARWNGQNGALQLLAGSGASVLRVRYEDLVSAPGPILRRIASFAGLDAGDSATRFLEGDGETGRWAHLRTAHTASGNPVRFQVGRIPIRVDDGWRTAMPARQRLTVTALTLPLLAHYGYVRPAGRGKSPR